MFQYTIHNDSYFIYSKHSKTLAGIIKKKCRMKIPKLNKEFIEYAGSTMGSTVIKYVSI